MKIEICDEQKDELFKQLLKEELQLVTDVQGTNINTKDLELHAKVKESIEFLLVEWLGEE